MSRSTSISRPGRRRDRRSPARERQLGRVGKRARRGVRPVPLRARRSATPAAPERLCHRHRAPRSTLTCSSTSTARWVERRVRPGLGAWIPPYGWSTRVRTVGSVRAMRRIVSGVPFGRAVRAPERVAALPRARSRRARSAAPERARAGPRPRRAGSGGGLIVAAAHPHRSPIARFRSCPNSSGESGIEPQATSDQPVTRLDNLPGRQASHAWVVVCAAIRPSRSSSAAMQCTRSPSA